MNTSWLVRLLRGIAPSTACYAAFLLGILIVGFHVTAVMAADDPEASVTMATLNGTGSGTKKGTCEDLTLQTIDYNYEVSFNLHLQFLDVQGDLVRYTIIGQDGSVRFWGMAEDSSRGYGFSFDRTANYAESAENGILLYSRSRQEVVSADFALHTQTGIRPYRVEYFGYVHPYSTRLSVDMGRDWCFDGVYESCSKTVGADFTGPLMIRYAEGTRVASNTGFRYNTDYGGSWRMIGLDAYLELYFDLDTVPESAVLVLRHLSSAYADCPGGGYSPINIRVNDTMIAEQYDPAENHGGTHQFVADQWEIGPYLRAGSNLVKITRGEKPCTHYWISNMDVHIRQPQPDCATCLLPRSPTLIVVIPGVETTGAEMVAAARPLSDRFCDLLTIPEITKTEDIPKLVAGSSKWAITNGQDLIINVDMNLDSANIIMWDRSTDWAGGVANNVSEEFTKIVPAGRRILLAHSAGGDAVSRSLRDSGGKKLYDDIDILNGWTNADDFSSRLAGCGYSWMQTKIFTSQGDLLRFLSSWSGPSVSNVGAARDKARAGAWVHLHCTKVWVEGTDRPWKEPDHNTLRNNYSALAEFELHRPETEDCTYTDTFIGAMRRQDWTSFQCPPHQSLQ